MGALWGIVTIVGPILFAAVLLCALLRTKFQKRQTPKSVSDRASRRLYAELNEQDESRETRGTEPVNRSNP
jgi:hypothetical protein